MPQPNTHDITSWLIEVEAGQEVGVRTQFRGPYPDRTACHKVARITRTQIVLDNGAKFRRSTGAAIPLSTDPHVSLFDICDRASS